MSFTRRIENFTCEQCGTEVKGDGYTNHCLKCLWSKHVDVEPGDRKAVCGGMMEPVACECAGGEWVLTHRCVACGRTTRNRISPQDNFDAATAISN